MNPSCKLPCYMNSLNSKMLQILLKQQLPAPKCCKFYGKWEVSTPKCCKDSWNGSFQLQNAATRKENVQKKRIQNKSRNGKNIIPTTCPDLFLLSGMAAGDTQNSPKLRSNPKNRQHFHCTLRCYQAWQLEIPRVAGFIAGKINELNVRFSIAMFDCRRVLAFSEGNLM